MERLGGMIGRLGLAMAGKRSPWGRPASPDGEGGAGAPPPTGEDAPKGPRNPWQPGGGGGPQERPRRSASIEDIFKNRGPEGPRRRGGPGGPGGPGIRLPERPGGGSWLPIGIAAIAAVWLMVTSIHQVGPKEQGIVTTFGKYSRTLQPGLNLTLPWPFQNVDVTDVTSYRSENIPDGNVEKLILTGDQNLVDLSYVVRWNIRDLQLYRFQLAQPDETIREVAEAAMRASVAEQNLDGVLSGAGRAQIEQRVHSRMQAILDAYRSGVLVQGVEIDRTDPPAQVVEAFKDVSAAQQDADADLNRAQAFAQQLSARAQGDAAEFDKIYEEYRMAPQVTRRRLYYETMESVLSKTNKTVVEPQGVTPYLALPQVDRRAAQPQAAQ
jgi:membrane protease subunit HflK